MSITTMSCFRLFDLPLDLLELLTLYFKGKEAVKLLTISCTFHDIFARSVWHTITINTIRVAEPIRSSAFARYGHLVRSIDLFNKLNSELDLHNWAQLFPNTTSLAFDILFDMEDGDKQTFMDAIADLHGLRSLNINMNTYILSIHLERLAKTLVIRHGDPNKQSLRELVLFSNLSHEVMEEAEMSWTDLGTLVQTLSPLRPPINLKIDMCGSSRTYAPTPAQMDILRPHLTRIPEFNINVNADRCMALHNRQYFSPSGTCDDPLVFDRLRMLDIDVCCASPFLFNYSDFTPIKFPVMKSMDITEGICDHRVEEEEGAGSAVQALLIKEWPELKDVRVFGRGFTLSVLDKLIKLNPQLTTLEGRISRNTNSADNVLILERAAGRLSHLTKFIIYGGPSMQIDSDWLQAACFVDISSSKLTCVSIHEIMLKPRLFEVLFALPNMQEMIFGNCILTELELIMSIFKKHRQTAKEDATVGITRLTITNLRATSNWSAELILELIAALPHLNLCTIYANHALRGVIQEKYPKTGDIGPMGRGRIMNRLIFNPQGQ